MNLDKIIKMKLIQLSSKYDISLIEISKVKDGMVKSVFNFSYQLLEDEDAEKHCETFSSKRKLVSWLVWLE